MGGRKPRIWAKSGCGRRCCRCYLANMSAVDAVARALAAVDLHESRVHAWAYLDPDRARAEARIVDGRPRGPLSGVTVGVKDMFDTVDQPTSFGSPLYGENRPSADAAAVALLREAGAVCLGKTVTAEFACFHPGPTTNPHRPTHTPGGSSMGSAAAVAAGMADVGLGTQTAASITRPASFCGIYGFKPSFGTVSVAGLKLVAPSLDTVGWLSRSPGLLERVWRCLTGRLPDARPDRPPRVGLVLTDRWEACSSDTRQAVESTVDRARSLGATVLPVTGPAELSALAEDHALVMGYEAARSLSFEHTTHRDSLSAQLCALLDQGRTVDPLAYDAARERAAEARATLRSTFAQCDVLLTPAVYGEAPLGLASTGDPWFGRTWTLLGLPTMCMPTLQGATGLPVGVQLVGSPGGDRQLLALTSWLSKEGAGAPRDDLDRIFPP